MMRFDERVRALAILLMLNACDDGQTDLDAGLMSDVTLADSFQTDATVSTLDAPALSDVPSVDSFDPGPVCAETSQVSTDLENGLSVTHRDGQSFVTWMDRAEGEAGAEIRYRVYRSRSPIATDADLDDAELIAIVLNHSAQLFGHGFHRPQRIDPEQPMAVLEEGGDALPLWSGLWVANARENGCAYYAVVATDLEGTPMESIEVGVNATTEAIAEEVGERDAIKIYDSNEREFSVEQTRITGTPGLPLHVILHASQGQGGPVPGGQVGDYYLYFGDRSMGYQEGMPGIFSVQETHSGPQFLMMRNRDTIVTPEGASEETAWFGYVTEPLHQRDAERLAYPFTERRLDWAIPWTIEQYGADPERVYVSGGSMGAWGTVTYAFRRPDRYAAVYPDRPRFRQRTMSNIQWDRSVWAPISNEDTLEDGRPWPEHHDSVQFVESHPEDLPFMGWNVGRYDGFATWQEQVDMVQAMNAGRHGFAFAWNDGDHATGSREPKAVIQRWYPPELFARNQSYPAFSNSSIDDDLGDGDPENGDASGGINLGFAWTVEADEEASWRVEISNELATEGMTVDVTPRRLQSFRATPDSEFEFSVAMDGSMVRSGTVAADANGLITVTGVAISPSRNTVITIRGGA